MVVAFAVRFFGIQRGEQIIPFSFSFENKSLFILGKSTIPHYGQRMFIIKIYSLRLILWLGTVYWHPALPSFALSMLVTN